MVVVEFGWADGDEDAYDTDDPEHRTRPWTAAWEIGDATVVWEFTSAEAIRPESLVEISAGGVEVFAVMGNASVSGSFAHAQDGVVLAGAWRMGGVTPDREPEGYSPARVAAAITRTEIDLAELTTSDCFALLREVMGVTIVIPDQDLRVIAARIKPRPLV